MQNSKLSNKDEQARKWQLWFLAAFSGFLIVTFGLYIPLRFQYQALSHEETQEEAQGVHEEETGPQEHGLVKYHEEGQALEGLVVNLNVAPAPFVTNSPLRLDFFVNQKPGNIPVENLEIEHEKPMHVIGVRNDMAEFFHLHPTATQTPGVFSVEHIFEKPGLYKIWSEIKVAGIHHIFGHPELAVEGEGEKFEKQVDFGRNKIVGDYQVALRLPQWVPANSKVELLFDIHTLDSFEVKLEDYLAAPMHLTLIKDDWQQFLHTHPEQIIEHSGRSQDTLKFIPEALANGGGHNTAEGGHGISFKINFPQPGLYKAFAQFRPQGIGLPQDQALLAEFWIEAKEKAESLPGPAGKISSWWINLIWASIAILLLSWAVKRYISRAKAGATTSP